MVGLFTVLIDIIEKLTIEWEAGVVMCKTIRFIQGIATYGSTYALVALSIDRLDSIARPLKSVSKGNELIKIQRYMYMCREGYKTLGR
jgi:neuropeptide S receptor 1